MKRAIIPEHPVPTSLAVLQQHVGSSLSCSTSSSLPVYAGPVSSLQTGDYVAVLVRQLGGTSTLLSQPLAKTSVKEFAQVFGSTTPGAQQLPSWLQAGGFGGGGMWADDGSDGILEAAAGQ